MSHSTPPTVGWYTTSEAMTRLGCSEATLKRRINTGELQAKTENRRRLILLPISTDNATALVAVEQSAMFAQLLAAEREALQLTRQTCAAVAESSRRAVFGWQVAAGLLLCVSVAAAAMTINADRQHANATLREYQLVQDREVLRCSVEKLRADLAAAQTDPITCEENYVLIAK